MRVLDALHLRDDSVDPRETRAAVAAIIARKTADEWLRLFEGVDACVSVVKSLQDAVQSPHFRARGVFSGNISSGIGTGIPALPLPISPSLMAQGDRGYPGLGEANVELLPPS